MIQIGTHGTVALLGVALLIGTGLLSFFVLAKDHDGGNSGPIFLSSDRSNQELPQLNLDSLPNQTQQQLPAQAHHNCTADQLLPNLEGNIQDRWVPLGLNETRLREYNCTCPYTKASYFCPDGRTDYPSWTPKSVADEECTPVSSDVLNKYAFPPRASVLFYGNSHLRQVVEGIMCSHKHTVVRREAMFVKAENRTSKTVVSLPGERQCRGCMKGWDQVLSDHSCVPKEEAELAMRCCDDRAVYDLENNATIRYWFANQEGNKSVEHAFTEFGTSVSDYDIIVANVGNDPTMHTDRVVSAARHFHDAGVPFLWLTTFDGEGDVRGWNTEDQQAFMDAGGKHIPVQDMMASMAPFTRGVAESREDHHFCLPGPPDELGRLILQLIWALYEESGRS